MKPPKTPIPTGYFYMKKKHIWWGQTSYIAIPGQRCFELISSHQQGIRTACPCITKDVGREMNRLGLRDESAPQPQHTLLLSPKNSSHCSTPTYVQPLTGWNTLPLCQRGFDSGFYFWKMYINLIEGVDFFQFNFFQFNFFQFITFNFFQFNFFQFNFFQFITFNFFQFITHTCTSM